MTIPAHHLLPGIPRHRLGGPIEIENFPREIVGDNPLSQAVQNIGQVVNLLPDPLSATPCIPGGNHRGAPDSITRFIEDLVFFFHGTFHCPLLIITA